MKTRTGTHVKKKSHGLREAERLVNLELRLSRIHRRAVKKAPKYWRMQPLKLHLGCGPNRKDGWVNVDLLDSGSDLQLDIREPWPFPGNSASYIYSEHVFEHFELHHEASHFLQEALRVLKSGGIFDVVVPDTEMALKAYGNPRSAYWPDAAKPWHPDWCQTELDHINYHFRQDGEHKYAWDAETLTRKLQSAGFISVSRREFNPMLDTDVRRVGSLYMLARKP